MKQPEIICDAPSRIDSGFPIPVFIIIKDAHLFPVQVDTVVIHAVYESGIERIARFPYHNLKINARIWWDSINITPEYPGNVKINPYVILTKGKRKVVIHVDNYNGTTHSPLIVFVASSPFPGFDGWYHGDIHCHSYYTSDQVEFGAPLEVMAFATYCMGLTWISITDHSYDLDDHEECYLSKDPLLPKWRIMREKAELLAGSVTVIPGEEVTCRTHNGRNCHLLSINSNKFIKGTGDSGKQGFNTKTEKSIGEAVSECIEWGGIACAAHPFEKVPFLEKLLLGRGSWSHKDLRTPGITAMQFYNGVRDRGFRDGMKNWIQFLLSGKRMYAFGGTDAHGDLNRCRCIGFPFVSVSEKRDHIFGSVRTVVHSQTKTRKDIIEALKGGHAVVSDGPFIDLEASSHNRIGHPGDELIDGNITVRALCISSSEFGALKKFRILAGIEGETNERILASPEPDHTDFEYSFTTSIELQGLLYIRAECETVLSKICFTNPIWFTKHRMK